VARSPVGSLARRVRYMQLAELVLQRAATLTSAYNNFYPYLAAISRGSNFKPLYNV
jgi:hypothetical protein